jgi:dipeptidyl aminopeptidase/acylaminoacyl peptidase
MRKALFLFLGLLLLTGGRAEPGAGKAKPAGKADAPAKKAADPGKWTVDDVVNMEWASDFQLAPGGRWCVWVKTVADKDKDELLSNLMRTDLKDGSEVALTRASDSCYRPRWSPDGKRLAFLSDRPAPKVKSKPAKGRRGREDEDDEGGKVQLWLMDPFGGEPWPLTEVARGVLGYDWAGPDALVFFTQEDPTRHEKALEEKKDDSRVVEDEPHEPPARLFKVEVKSKKVTRLTDNTDRIEWLAVSPDGKFAVTAHGRSLRYTFDNKVKPVVFLHDLEAGKAKQVFADPKFNLGAARWAPDGRGFYALNEYTSQPQLNQAGVTEVYYYDLGLGRADRVPLDWERGVAPQEANNNPYGLVPTATGFVALLNDGARPRAARYVRDDAGWKRQWLTGEHAGHLFAMQASADGKTLLYAYSTASTPVQWYHAALQGAKIARPKSMAVLNEYLDERPKARTEVVRWKGAQDDDVEGILYYPHDYKAGERRPLVVLIHGGPASHNSDCWGESWSYAPNLYCGRGAFVLRPNYHGSTGYGLKFLESISRGKYLDLETIDIDKGVDALIARGLVDADRLGLGGWSNGAILTNQLTTLTTRYKAAMSGAGNVEYVSDWATCEFGDAFDRYYLGKSPLEDPELYLKKSPFFRLDKVRTPTIIFSGTEDRVVATEQSWVQYRALQQLAKTDVRFVLFPGEKHALKKLSHRRRKLEEELSWFDKYLFKTAKSRNEALKPNSPLAWALGRKKAKRVAGSYGVAEKGELVPETVAYQGLRLGRFEVTRAQFARFDKTYKVDPGKENYPATGVSFKQARGYCDWLSRLTGRAYRLPTVKEAEELYDASEPGENTLDRWAGYKVNPDDAARLRDEIKGLGAGALLREVGAGRGEGEGDQMVFDLGGNAAEWVTGEDGKGVLKGSSADTPADDRQTKTAAAPEYRGFRVVQEEGEKKPKR